MNERMKWVIMVFEMTSHCANTVQFLQMETAHT